VTQEKDTVNECCLTRWWLEEKEQEQDEPGTQEFYEIAAIYQAMTEIPLCPECLAWIARRT